MIVDIKVRPMINDDFSSCFKAFESIAKMLKPYQDALDVIEKSHGFTNVLSDPLADRFRLIDGALKTGIFDERLSKSVSKMLAPYHEISGIRATLEALGKSFSPLIDSSYYQTIAEATRVAKGNETAIKMSIQLEPVIHSTQLIDTSWMGANNRWNVKKSILESMDISAISGMASSFANLCKLEQRTALLTGISDTLISASSQIASITSSMGQNASLGNFFSSCHLLIDYCGLATKQHKLIQKADSSEEIEWRLGVLDAASKYVDRQIEWGNGFAEAVSDEGLSIPETNEESWDEMHSPVTLIPTYVGYTRRIGIDSTPTEGLEASAILQITEKGKSISEGITKINKLRLDKGDDRVFSLSETVLMGLLDVSTTICCAESQLGKIIDGLYFTFYENIEHLKVVVGGGDKVKGDEIVRRSDLFQCIFDIKTIRNDLRHDLDHGNTSDRKKKLKSVGDCYKKYCGHRPIKERDFRNLQEKIYDEVLKLEQCLIEVLLEQKD